MEIFKINDYLIWPALAVFLFGFFGVAIAVVKAISSKIHNRPIKAPYLSFILLGVGLCFYVTSKAMMISALHHSAFDKSYAININPPIAENDSEFFKSIMAGLGQFKLSGSYPTGKKWLISVCKDENRTFIEVARDSRSANLYWVSYKANGVTLTLGYSRLEDKSDEI